MKRGVSGRRPVRAFASMLVLAALAAGCSDSPEKAEDIPSAAPPQNVTATVSEEIVTVVSVSWTTEEPSLGYVEYGPTEALGMTTPMYESTIEHTQLLLGLKADTVYYYRVVTWDGADAGKSELANVRTGYLPPALPELECTGSGHEEFITVPLLGALRAILLIDPDGEIVWYYVDESELDHYRVRLSRDGKGVLYNNANISGEPATDSEIVRVSFDGLERTTLPIPLLAHDFVEHDDGTIAAIVLEDRDVDGTLVRGNKIVEVDRDGNSTDIWSSWNCFDYAEVPNDDPSGWTFANALDYDPSDDVYYVGMRTFSSIARVSRETGECEWVLGATAATLEFAQGTARFQHQHQFQIMPGASSRQPDRLLVLDNEGALAEESRVVEYELDLETNVATEIWRFTSTPPIFAFVLGEPIRLANGDTFVNWSAAGQMERVTPAGESIWRLNSEVGAAFGFNTLAATLYPPGTEFP